MGVLLRKELIEQNGEASCKVRAVEPFRSLWSDFEAFETELG